jgi:hypothetical protein
MGTRRRRGLAWTLSGPSPRLRRRKVNPSSSSPCATTVSQHFCSLCMNHDFSNNNTTVQSSVSTTERRARITCPFSNLYERKARLRPRRLPTRAS